MMKNLFDDVFTWIFVLSFALPLLRRLLSPPRSRKADGQPASPSSQPAPATTTPFDEVPTYEEYEEVSLPSPKSPTPETPASLPKRKETPLYDVAKQRQKEYETRSASRSLDHTTPLGAPKKRQELPQENEWVEALQAPQSAGRALILGEILKPKFD